MAAQLMVEGVPAVELAERFGTPLFAISENSIRERYRRTLAAVRAVYDPVEVYYAVKSNPILAVRRILAQEGAGGDAFGPGEVETSLRAGVPGEKLVMNGQAKTAEWLELAVKHGITVTLDNPGELELLLRGGGPGGRAGPGLHPPQALDGRSAPRRRSRGAADRRPRAHDRVGVHRGRGEGGGDARPRRARPPPPARLPPPHRLLHQPPRLPRRRDARRRRRHRPPARRDRLRPRGARRRRRLGLPVRPRVRRRAPAQGRPARRTSRRCSSAPSARPSTPPACRARW